MKTGRTAAVRIKIRDVLGVDTVRISLLRDGQPSKSVIRRVHRSVRSRAAPMNWSSPRGLNLRCVCFVQTSLACSLGSSWLGEVNFPQDEATDFLDPGLVHVRTPTTTQVGRENPHTKQHRLNDRKAQHGHCVCKAIIVTNRHGLHLIFVGVVGVVLSKVLDRQEGQEANGSRRIARRRLGDCSGDARGPGPDDSQMRAAASRENAELCVAEWFRKEEEPTRRQYMIH